MTDETLDKATRLVLDLLPLGAIDRDVVVETCDDVLGLLSRRSDGLPDREQLIRRIESLVVVEQAAPDWLFGTQDHVQWLHERKGGIAWTFWERYRRYLEQIEFLPPNVISRLDDSTDRVLAALNDPLPPGRWDRRGLVVGQVQSGKTGHYTGLACKAADAGYSLIVVLAGMHDSLRSQTQLRLDQGLLGFDTQYQHRTDEQSRYIGVGAMLGADRPAMASLTTSKDDGDFQAVRARHLALPIGQIPILLVVKKNAYILRNLYQWLSQMHGEKRPNGDVIVPDVPLLLIDDEADNASMNTKKADEDPGTINRRIRQLLYLFEKSAYVGYTATPFANIFSSTEEDDVWGRDLFPKDFVESLKPPSNYFGPVKVFGLGLESDVVEPAPIYRRVADHDLWMPDKHKKDWVPDEADFPASLRRATFSFVISCAARRVRGDSAVHNSMLVHTTRYVDVQGHVTEQVENLLLGTRYRLKYGNGASNSVEAELRSVWESDYLPSFRYWKGKWGPLNWKDVAPHLLPAAEKILVKTLNGNSTDALQYYENRQKGLSVIAIGGDKLSRGLTLEGLSVSYYLRASKMYDTLLQMGRWFGYRPGYEDLCRLFTTPDLFDWYREITIASEELRDDFEDMAHRNATPSDYGLRVRQSPAGLLVTSPSKMRNATRLQWSYSGDISESVTFSTEPKDLEANLDTLNHLLQAANLEAELDRDGQGNNLIWSGVNGTLVADFFSQYRADPGAKKARPELIERYIRDAIALGELVNWTVVLVNNSRTQRKTKKIEGAEIGLTERKALDAGEIPNSARYTIGRLVSPQDELLDLPAATQSVLRAKNGGKLPGGATIRHARAAENGLLLIYPIDSAALQTDIPMVGFGVSFPYSEHHVSKEYQANVIFRKIAFEQLEEDSDDTPE